MANNYLWVCAKEETDHHVEPHTVLKWKICPVFLWMCFKTEQTQKQGC